MFITRDEIKDLIGLADTDSYDQYIEKAILAAEKFVLSETKNFFEVHTDKVIRSANTISFDKASNAILDSENLFMECGFISGLLVRVKGSFVNDSFYQIKTVTAGSLVSDTSNRVKDEAAGFDVRITVCQIPEEVKLFIAKFINHYKPSKTSKENISSEKFDDYSVTYLNTESLPEDILELLDPFRKLKWD